MCGRTRLVTDYSEIKIALKLDDSGSNPNIKRSWNVAPTDEMLVVRFEPGRGRISEKMKWGLIPAWSKEPKMSGNTINARAETVDTAPAFRDAWRKRQRCLVVTDGFYEWRKKDKQPFAIARAKNQMTIMAGLWEEWRAKDGSGEIVRSCTVITTSANELIGELHDRMPVILAEADWPAWLGEVPATDADLKALLKPFPSEEMELWPIDKRVGNWRNNDEDLLNPVRIDDPGFV